MRAAAAVVGAAAAALAVRAEMDWTVLGTAVLWLFCDAAGTFTCSRNDFIVYLYNRVENRGIML